MPGAGLGSGPFNPCVIQAASARQLLGGKFRHLRTQRNVDVLVVGAGPAGIVAGCHLARAGLETLVLERNENFKRELRFHKAMRDMGPFDHVRSIPHE